MQIVNTSSSFTAINGNSVENDGITNEGASSSSASAHSSNTIAKTDEMVAPVTPSAAVYVKSISEFPLNSGILSFSIVDAAVRRYKCATDNYMCEELDDYDEETSSIYCVVVHMYIVQSKSMQECHILYQPTVQENAEIKSTISSDSCNQNTDNNSNKANTSEENVVEQKANDGEAADNGKDRELNVKSTILGKDDTSSADTNALEILLGITNSTAGSSHTNMTSNSGGSNVVAVAAAAAAAPSVIATESKMDSRNQSPNVSTNSAAKPYTQVNLMTPDAFTSSATNGKQFVICCQIKPFNL